jgi:hypothetical protein
MPLAAATAASGVREIAAQAAPERADLHKHSRSCPRGPTNCGSPASGSASPTPLVRTDLSTFAWDQAAISSVRQHLVSFSRLLVFGHALVEPDLDGDSEGPQW